MEHSDVGDIKLGDAATATKPGLIRHLVCADGQRAEILKVFGQLLIGED